MLSEREAIWELPVGQISLWKLPVGFDPRVDRCGSVFGTIGDVTAGDHVAERKPEQIEDLPPDRDDPRRDWVGRLLEQLSRLSRPSAETRPDEQRLRLSPPLILALLALAVAASVAIGLIITSRADETELEATRMTLELTYPTTGEPIANLEGQPDAAPSESRITCRATDNDRRLGEGRAAADGSFDIALDATTWPLDNITRDSYQQLNTTVECRAGTGPWTEPLRPPRVVIN